MTGSTKTATAAILLLMLGDLDAQDGNLELHDDYYLGFSQGAYYGLMLAGVEYDVAWCVKSELDFEGDGLGSGSEFQDNLERIYTNCRQQQ
jgi:hypothetical protein